MEERFPLPYRAPAFDHAAHQAHLAAQLAEQQEIQRRSLEAMSRIVDPTSSRWSSRSTPCCRGSAAPTAISDRSGLPPPEPCRTPSRPTASLPTTDA